MSLGLFIEQVFNGLQLGMILFLMAVGVTLTFGVMNLINLAHGSMLMIGAFLIAFAASTVHSFGLAILLAMVMVFALSWFIEKVLVKHLYAKTHLDQVLASFGLSIVLNDGVIMIWGREPLYVNLPSWLEGPVQLTPTFSYPLYRLVITGVAILAGLVLWYLLTKTRLGMQIRAGAEKREMIGALGVNINFLFTAVFAMSAILAALGGVMLGPMISVQSGMGDPLLILSLAVVVIGGIGSLKGALYAALLVGLVDTLGRMVWPSLLGALVGNIVSNAAIYILMALVIAIRPSGLFGRQLQ
ncbi:MAG: branched-chain amino acid ABC transporter permease [Betaproteobacteria bacterium]|jgi:branched-chain amino acid transport system permease protein